MSESPIYARSSHRADIQGLRAIAVLGVVAYHATHSPGHDGIVPGGFAGVDMFFVLSGYLITQVLMRPFDTRSFSLLDFYRRRVRRLFPALFVMLTFVLVVGLFVFPPVMLKELSFTQFFTTLFLSNLAFIRVTGYFDLQAELKPLLHTWSLGVEEQFYLFYPLILYGLWRWLKPALWWVMGGVLILSLWAAQAMIGPHPTEAFYHPVGRAWELMIGALGAGPGARVLKSLSSRPRAQAGLGLIGLGLIAFSLFGLDDHVPFPGLNALWPCVGTLLCLLAAGGPVAERILSLKPMVVAGNMSYSLYLWHWPVLVLMRFIFPNQVWAVGLAVLIAFGAASASRRFVELPFLDGRFGREFRLGGAMMVSSLIACLIIYNGKGLPQRFSPHVREAFAASGDFNPDRKHCHLQSDGHIPYDQTCIYGRGPVAFAIWGDSSGAELARVLGQKVGEKGFGLRSITASGCPPSVTDLNPHCRAHNIEILERLNRDPDIRTVMLTANYRGYEVGRAPDMPEGLIHAATALAVAGKSVIILYPNPIYGFDPPSEAGLALMRGQDPAKLGMSRAEYVRINARTVTQLDAFMASAPPGISALKPSDIFCADGFCHISGPEGRLYYFNAGHLSLTGAAKIAERLMTRKDFWPHKV